MYREHLIVATGPRHPRGEWRIRVALRWPANKPYGAAAFFDIEHTLSSALFEDVHACVPQLIEDFIAQNDQALRQKRDRETIHRIQRDPRASRA